MLCLHPVSIGRDHGGRPAALRDWTAAFGCRSEKKTPNSCHAALLHDAFEENVASVMATWVTAH